MNTLEVQSDKWSKLKLIQPLKTQTKILTILQQNTGTETMPRKKIQKKSPSKKAETKTPFITEDPSQGQVQKAQKEEKNRIFKAQKDKSAQRKITTFLSKEIYVER